MTQQRRRNRVWIATNGRGIRISLPFLGRTRLSKWFKF